MCFHFCLTPSKLTCKHHFGDSSYLLPPPPPPIHTHSQHMHTLAHTNTVYLSPSTMDSILSDFIDRTKADPALAQDLLDAADWNIESALALFDGLKDTRAVEPKEYQYDPSKYASD